jgi:hypothetical protein
MSNPNTSTQVARDMQLVAGIKKHLNNASLIIAGKTYTAADAVNILQARIDAANAIPPAKAAWQNLVKLARSEVAQTKLFVSALRQAIRIMFSQAVDTLADFGISPQKTRKTPTPAKKVVTTAKIRATRAARHTMGKTQKLEIEGTVPPVLTIKTTGTKPEVSAPVPDAPLASASGAPVPAVGPGGNPSAGSIASSGSGSAGGTNGAPPQAPPHQ